MLGRAGTCSDCAGSWSQVQSHARGCLAPPRTCVNPTASGLCANCSQAGCWIFPSHPEGCALQIEVILQMLVE